MIMRYSQLNQLPRTIPYGYPGKGIYILLCPGNTFKAREAFTPAYEIDPTFTPRRPASGGRMIQNPID